MQTKSLWVAALLTLGIAAGALSAQGTVQLGNEASGNAFPFNFSAGFGRFQSAYNSTDLNLPNGTTIDTIWVCGSTPVAVPTYDNLQIRIGYTTLAVNALTTSFDTNYTMGTLTTVYGPTNIQPNQIAGSGILSWYEFPLATPFVYNGTGTILLDWTYTARSSAGWTISSGTAPAGENPRSRAYQNGTATAAAGTTGGNFGIRFEFTLPPNSVVAYDQSPAASVLYYNVGASDVVLMDVELNAITTARTINSMTFTQLGTIADSALTNIRLIQDDNDNGAVDLTDTVLGTGTLSSGSITFTNAPLITVGTTGPVRVLLAVNHSGSLTVGNTVQFSIASAAAVTWSGGTDITSYPLSSSVWDVVDPTIPGLLYYKFNEGTGTTTANSANPGVGPNPVNLSGNYSWYTPSQLGASAIAFSGGASGGFSTTWTPTFTNNDSWTMEFWINGAPAATNYIIGTGSTSAFRIYTASSGGLTMAGTGFTTITLAGGVLDSTWHHVAYVFNAGAKTMTVYVDGTQVAQTTGQTTAALSTGTLHIGGVGTTATGFNGRLDDFRLWDFARPQVDIQNTSGIELPLVNAAVITSVATAGQMASSGTNIPVARVNVNAFVNNKDLNSIAFTRSGTVSDAQISAVTLYHDMNADGLVDAGDVLLGTGPLVASKITFSGSPLRALTVGTPVALLLTMNTASTLSAGSTVQFNLAASTDVVFSAGVDQTSYPLNGSLNYVPLSGLVTINQTSGDYTDIGDAFDALETFGISGPVILQITDSATYVADASYSLGMNSETDPALQMLTPVQGASATNTITLRAAVGQTPKVEGSATGAILFRSSATAAQTGRGGLVINQSYVTVEGIEVFGGPHFGIMAQGNNTTGVVLNTTDITIRRCIVRDIPSGPGIAFMGLLSGYATNFLVEHNFVYNCLTASIAATPALQTLTNGSITVRNNQNPTVGAAIVRHNTVVHTSTLAGTAGIYFYSSSTSYALADVSNNIVVMSSTTLPALHLGSTALTPQIADFNYWFATVHCNQTTLATFALWQGTGRDANGSNANPQLLSTSAPFDLRLNPASPCIDPTGQTSAATIDIFGTTRPQGTTVDIGAHEADWTASLFGIANTAAPASITSALTTDQWVGSVTALSVLSIQQVNSVTFTHIGTTGNGSFTNLKLWIDANANGVFDGTDVQLGSTVASLTGSTVTFSGTPLAAFTAQNQSAALFITAQIAASATLGTAQFQVTASTDVSASPGPVAGSFPIAGAAVNIVNPAPTLVPATGSGFNPSRLITVTIGQAMSNATLTAGDANNPTISITVVAVSAAPGVTQPSNSASATVPTGLSWTGTPNTLGNYTYDVTLSDGINSPTFTVTINVVNPPPTLSPATGSAFNASRQYLGFQGVALADAILTADDVNDPTVAITITAVSAAPGVTQPADNANASVPFNLTWTGTPTATGNFSYNVNINDGVNNVNFTVSINISNPPPTLVPATGSAFNASRQYAGLQNVALANAVLTANDLNDATVAITITAVSAAPGVTQPADNPTASVPFNLTWIGTPTAVGNYSYTVNINDGTNNTNFTVSINVTNPAPTLVPATGSAFNAARTYAGLKNTALTNAVLTANDANESTVAITITAVTAAPGVTQPADNAAATVPFDLTWTGTPTSHGTFTYTVTVSDGVNTPVNFTVTFNIAHPALSGTYTISQTLAADFTDIGDAFDILETAGVTGAVILEIIDSANYTSTASYTLGATNAFALTSITGLSATNTITLRAAAGQTPVITGSATGAGLTGTTGRGALAIACSFVTVEGLTATGGPNFGIAGDAYNASIDSVTIRRCRAHGIPSGPGIAVMGFGSNRGTNILIENNFIWDCLTTALPGSVLPSNMNGSLSTRNAASTTTIRHNTILHNSSVASSSGFRTMDGSGSPQAIGEFSSNVIVVTSGSLPALHFATAAAEPAIAGTNDNVYFATVFELQNTTPVTFATWQATGRDTNGSDADPMLVSTTAPFDLHLQASSIAIDRATGSTATIDIDGNVRPAGRAADSGAHEAQVPEIELLQGTTGVNYNTTINLGNVATTTGGTFTFTIENNGVTDLILSGTPTVLATIVSNLDPGSGVTVQPASTTIAAAGSTTFDVFLDPTINLAFSISISIANNDSDRAPFIFTISGTGFTPNGDAEADPATGSSFTGGTNGPFSMAVNPGTVLANASIELTDPELDNITVTAIVAPTTVPTGITAPAIPAVGQPLTLTWTGTADASNAPGAYTWEVTFQDAGNGTPVTVFVTITINDIPPAHVILNATGGNGGAGNPYTAFWTETQNAGAVIDMATVTDANTSQILALGTITPGGANPVGGSGFTITLSAGMLSASPTAALVAADVGVHTFNVEVTDGTNTVNVHLSLTVSAAPNITTVSPLTDGEQGVSYTALQFVATGGTGALTWTVTGGSLPSGMTLTGAGLFSGIPALAGVYNFDLTATDSVGVFDTAAFQITVDPPAAGNPAITTTSPLLGGIVGNAYGPVTITAAGGTPGYSFSIVSGSLPAGLTMSTGGIITGTPSVQGTATFDVRVTDAAFATDTDTFSITIASVPGGGGGGSGGGGGGCAAEGSSTSTLWGLLLGMPALMYLARRRRAARK